MKNMKKTLATLLALSLLIGGTNKAFASENIENQSPSIFEILTSNTNKEDKKEDRKEDKKTDEKVVVKSYENDPTYKEEYKSRHDLYEKIILAKEMGNIEIDGFIDVLNKKAATKEDLEMSLAELNKLIDESDDKIALDLDIDGLREDVRDYILYGRLFFADKLDKTDIKNLYLFYEATVNSYTYTHGSKEIKKDFNPVLEEIYDYILEVDKKVEDKVEITDEDKKKTSELFDKLSKLTDENSGLVLKLESTSLLTDGFLANANESDGDINVNSTFYKSERPGIKEAYEKLPYSQREFLDNINKDNDDYITEDEIRANGQFSLPLEGPNSEFIKPFMKEEQKSAEVTSTEMTTGDTSQSQAPATTPPNPQAGTPETVTISQGENSVGTANTKDKKEEPSPITKAASQVKTGIEGVGYLGIVLIIALAAYFVLAKKKKEDNEEK